MESKRLPQVSTQKRKVIDTLHEAQQALFDAQETLDNLFTTVHTAVLLRKIYENIEKAGHLVAKALEANIWD